MLRLGWAVYRGPRNGIMVNPGSEGEMVLELVESELRVILAVVALDTLYVRVPGVRLGGGLGGPGYLDVIGYTLEPGRIRVRVTVRRAEYSEPVGVPPDNITVRALVLGY